jgi:hypothetical protein
MRLAPSAPAALPRTNKNRSRCRGRRFLAVAQDHLLQRRYSVDGKFLPKRGGSVPHSYAGGLQEAGSASGRLIVTSDDVL